RYFLPLVAFAAVGLSAALARAVAEAPPGWRRRALQAVALAAPLWVAWEAWVAWPNGLCYVNEAWGGPAQGYKLLSGSDYDWGQGLKELRAWQRSNGAPTLDVIYFGMDPVVRRPPFHPLPAYPGPEALLAGAHGRFVAVGTSILYNPNPQDPLGWLRRLRP